MGQACMRARPLSWPERSHAGRIGAMLIDSHCHLADARLRGKVEAILARARAAGVGGWIVPTATCDEWMPLARLGATYTDIRPAYGVHPWYCAAPLPDKQQWLTHLDSAVAVGECGLDLAAGRPPLARQLEVFRVQLELALALDLPVIVHAHKALDLVLKELRRYPARGVVHGFTGSARQAEQCLRQGLLLGIGKHLLRRHKASWRDTVRLLPEQALLLESDAPDGLAEPAQLIAVARELAKLRQTDMQTLIACCNHNARRLFQR